MSAIESRFEVLPIASTGVLKEGGSERSKQIQRGVLTGSNLIWIDRNLLRREDDDDYVDYI